MEKETESTTELNGEEFDWDAFFEEEKDGEWEEKKKRRTRRKSFLVKLIASILAFSMLISGLHLWFDLFNIPAIHFLEASKRLSDIPEVSEYKQSVVSIESDGKKGTGFNIDKNGLIITNAHVVENTKQVTVHFKNEGSFIGKVISKNAEIDLAIIDIDAQKLPTLVLSLDEDWEHGVGEKIIFIGNPLSYTQIANEGTVTDKVTLQDWKVPVMVIDAPIYKGNSGSPVINKNGKVIGIIFATITSDTSKKRVGLAIPASYLKSMLE